MHKDALSYLQEQAACRNTDSNIFFPIINGGTPPNKRAKIEAPAKAICSLCPVEARCLDYALEYRQNDGIWGGLNDEERATLRRIRRKASRDNPNF